MLYFVHIEQQSKQIQEGGPILVWPQGRRCDGE
jgi:hypothetical protein